MKYMNHLRKLALLSSLALSFVAYGDGTLPLPVVLDGSFTELAEASGSNLSLNLVRENGAIVPNIPGYGNPCDESVAYEFKSVSGSLTIGSNVLNVYGVCTYSASNLTKFAIVATKAQTVSIMNVQTVTKAADNKNWKNLRGQLELESPDAVTSGSFNLKAP